MINWRQWKRHRHIQRVSVILIRNAGKYTEVNRLCALKGMMWFIFCVSLTGTADELEGERMEVLVEAQETDSVFEIVEEEELEEDENCKEAAVKHEDKEAKAKKPYESEDSEEEISTTTPEMEGASIVKYSVKTTPYLQR